VPRLPKSIVLNTKGYKISSPEGMVPFFGIIKITKNQYLCLKFSSGDSIKCSEDHPIMTIDGIVKAKHLDKDIEIITQFGGCFLVYKRLVRKTID